MFLTCQLQNNGGWILKMAGNHFDDNIKFTLMKREFENSKSTFSKFGCHEF